MNKQQLASTIWQSANQMRSKIEANEYKDYILGFMFYKYLSDREISFLKGEKYSDEDIKKVTADDEKLVKHISENIGYFIAYEDLFSSWLSKGDDFDVSDVRDALSNFDANIEPTYKKLFENIFKTLQSGLSKLGETSTKQTKSIKALLKLIKRIPMDGKQDYDVLGFIYEYLISMFAANAGKKAGEFYTPHGVLFRGGEEETIRKTLIERNHIEAIIGLPANIFFGTGIPTIIMVLKRTRSDSDILIIDASKKFEKVGKNNKLRARDIREIVDTLKARKSVTKFAKLVTKDDIRKNEYNLNIPRYVDSSDDEEPWDIHSIMFGGIPNMEIESLRKYWDAFPGLREEIFGNISDNYARVIADDIESAVSNFASVSNYIAKYHSSFSGFGEYLKDCLIEDILDVNAQSLKENICIDIFNRTTNIKLIDQYKAFQILSENWETITADLEMIQGEGFDAIFQVDPNMVVKKKKEDEDEVTEVQEGWKGHILPFELVQEEFHHGELFAIQSGEERLVEISNMYTEILESLEEDELEQTITNDDKNAFVGKEVKAYVTEALTDVESPEINALKNYLTLSFKKDKMAFIEENPFVAWSAMVSNKDGTYGKPAVNSRILQLQMEFEFPEESLEAKMKRVMLLMEEESELKKVIKAQKIELEAATIETIKNLDEEDALRLLELKWIEPIVSGLGTLPDDVITALVSEVENLNSKYATTYSDIEVKKEFL